MKMDEIKESAIKAITFFTGVLIMAITYNLFTTKYNFVTGGVGGLSIIYKNIFKTNPVYFIYGANIVLLFISDLLLEKTITKRALLGSILYPVLISLTAPILDVWVEHVRLDNIIITIILTGCLLGIGNSLVYKAGFTTGGGDITMKLITKYGKVTEGKATLIQNVIIVLLGGITLGLANVIYSIMIIVIITTIEDKISIGISDSKMFLVHSHKNNAIRKYLVDELDTGSTILQTKGGLKKEDKEMLLVVVPTRDYYRFKEVILRIDPKAFFIVSDCYEVNGGVKRKNLPFI